MYIMLYIEFWEREEGSVVHDPLTDCIYYL